MNDRQFHILVVDDAREIRDPLVKYFQKNGYRAMGADGAASARRLLRTRSFDLAVLDVMMPGEDGLSLCRHLRDSTDIPVLFLTAKCDEIDRIVGIEIGADDYMGKPFNPRELLARAGAILRRVHSLPPQQAATAAPRLQFGDWVLDTVRRELINPEGVGIALSTGEYKLLHALLERPKIVLKREDLLDITCGRDAQPFDRAIDNAVMRLRRKLEEDPRNPRIIKTVWGGGYVLAAEPVALS